MMGISDPSASIEAAVVDRLVAFYRPGIVFFEFDRRDGPGRYIVEQAQRRHPRLPILVLTEQPTEIDLPEFQPAVAGQPDLFDRVSHLDALVQHGRGGRKDDPRLARTRAAVAYVQGNLAQRITLAAAAASCHMCKSEFSRTFKREHDETFFEFVLRTRVRRAAELLAGGNVAVKQAAYAVGFNDVSYFGRVFRRHFGIAPSQYVAGEPAALAHVTPPRRVTPGESSLRA
jgi:AraC-like DNA-binding protein